MYDGEVESGVTVKRPCFKPRAGHLKEEIGKLCTLKCQGVIFEVWCARKVCDPSVSGPVVIVHTDGLDRYGAKVEGCDPTGFSAILYIGVRDFEVCIEGW
jgi:hypothetical protein